MNIHGLLVQTSLIAHTTKCLLSNFDHQASNLPISPSPLLSMGSVRSRYYCKQPRRDDASLRLFSILQYFLHFLFDHLSVFVHVHLFGRHLQQLQEAFEE